MLEGMVKYFDFTYQQQITAALVKRQFVHMNVKITYLSFKFTFMIIP